MDGSIFRSTKDKPLKILIADDVEVNLQLLMNILQREGYDIILARDGREAISMAKQEFPDLILLDIMMPEINGFDVCNELMADSSTRDIRIIFLTAKTSSEDIVKGFDVGAVDYVTKPFNKTELLARVKTHIELKRSHEELAYSYSKLKQAQQNNVELEKKNSVLAMAVTANHELNQPLMVVMGYVELLKNDLVKQGLTEKQEKYFTKLETSLDQIKSTLEKFAKSESLQYTSYADGVQMVVFDDKKNKNDDNS